MVNSNENGRVFGGLYHLVLVLLLLFAGAPGVQCSVDVGIEPDDGGKWRLKGPVDVGLRHGAAIWAVLMAHGVTEVTHEAEQRGLCINRIAGARGGIAIVVSGDGEN